MASLAEQFLDDVESDSDEAAHPTDNLSPPSSLPSAGSDATRALSSLLSRITDFESAPAPVGGSPPGESALVSACTQAAAHVDAEISRLHERLLAAHAPAFPELRTLIPAALDYARVAALSANAPDLTKVDLRGVLPSGTAIAVQVTYSASARRELDAREMREVRALCEEMGALADGKARVLRFVESRAGGMAPNLVAVVGGAVAALLMGAAGGLAALARMPSCNVKVLGRGREAVQEGRGVGHGRRGFEGVVYRCPLVMGLPERFRNKAGQVVAGKAALAARVDACEEGQDGGMGRRLRAELEKKFEKWQEPGPARTAKPLPVPGEEARKRHRGGKRARREKERMGMTEVRKLASRVKFGEAERRLGNDLEHEGLGMLGAEGSQRLRVQSKKTDSVAIAAKRRLAKQRKKEGVSEAEQLGITSNLSMAGMEGMQLAAATPAPGGVGVGAMEAKGTASKSNYFSASTPFLGVTKGKREIAKTPKSELKIAKTHRT